MGKWPAPQFSRRMFLGYEVIGMVQSHNNDYHASKRIDSNKSIRINRDKLLQKHKFPRGHNNSRGTKTKSWMGLKHQINQLLKIIINKRDIILNTKFAILHKIGYPCIIQVVHIETAVDYPIQVYFPKFQELRYCKE